ncbi:non-ribosomal peptide synthetase [Streptomyces luteolus]|uniref:Phenyloxazoline synthase MbtB n=1 Tax=Streptomyces luteolus TaxID=3043615 RepID=A0ABT6SY45_9ACTN|nr:non-ribosomal peptide synthetase [Streptomyces sp. B-S-A12]MDI3419577.1 amino acid adenylation domain-containing protein [Streptomyces sp. B-S-A12]
MVHELIGELENIGVRLWEEGGLLRYRAPRNVLTEARLEQLKHHKQAVLDELRRRAGTQSQLTADPEARHEPFPLTDVQSSYLLGRSTAYQYGGVGCEAYVEVRFPAVDPRRVADSWHRLVERHDALRTIVHPDGYQQVLPQVPEQPIRITDLREAAPGEQEQAVRRIRTELSAREYRSDQWPLHDLRITRTSEHTVIHLSVDLLICDYASVQLLLGELEQLSLRSDLPLPALEIGYRDYLMAERRLRDTAFERDREYWWRRLPGGDGGHGGDGRDSGDAGDGLPESPETVPLPASPTLPVRSHTVTPCPPRFERLQAELEPEAWAEFRRRAAARGVTPTSALLTAYAEVIGRWSGQSRFTLNLPMFNRLPLHPQTAGLVGDFTSVELLAVDCSAEAPFAVRAAATQAQLWQDLDHQLYSGVEVLRELARRSGQDAALMPVVFTSTVGLSTADTEARHVPRLKQGKIVYGCSRTPHVWIDCQVMEDDDALLLGWDVRVDALPEGLPADAFRAFEDTVRRLAASDEPWTAASVVTLPPAQLDRRAQVNDTALELPERLLHEGVLAQALAAPERTAVISGSTVLTYRQLMDRAQAVAEALAADGDPAGRIVAVVMDKGWEQVAAVLGTLLAGAAYLPIDTDQPPARRDSMLTDAGATTVLTQPWIATDWPAGVRVVPVDEAMAQAGGPAARDRRVAPDDLAYVIYTSGSTGAPKGVMISHRAAVNTVMDINQRFSTGPEDRVLGLAGLGFDLSVYDIFGPLARGGCLVLPDAARRGDPAHWAELADRHRVTLWNSVPAQLQMLDSYLASGDGPAPSALRLALLSGDWIPVPLVEQIRGRLPHCELISLGGATEAAIWSIVHPIGTGPVNSRTVPYGTPLANQGWHVLDDQLRDCPDLTPGELYISGTGLALGYLGDEARTAERFVTRPGEGERLYRTGDLGRYLPDGTIELLGRVDDQVKIRGHRVEPAEVSAAAEAHPAVASAVTLVTGADPASRRLATFVTTVPTESARLTADGAATVAAATATGLEVSSTVDGELLAQLLELADEVALDSMARTLCEAGLFMGATESHTAEEAAAGLGAHHRHLRAVRRWLRALAGAGRLHHDPVTGRYAGLAAPDPATLERDWQHLEELGARLHYGTDLLRLIRTSSRHLPELLSGEEDPLRLLFPQGNLNVAEAAYRDNLVSRSLNRVAVAGLRELASAHRRPGPLRVLEVGAGVGGTSTELIPALDGLDVEYLFTDVSQFFLGEAQQRFQAYPWVRYGLFDVNTDPAAQGLAPNTFDVVLCANVLHNSKDAADVLRRLRELLVPGGWLVFMEATLERHPLLVSMEFIDGLSGGFTDLRQAADQTFLTREQWLGLLAEAGAEVPLCFPAPDDILSQAGQHLFFTRLKTDRTPLAGEELARHLADRLPEHMRPARLEILDEFPLSANGKIDRARLHRRLPEPTADRHGPAGAAEPTDELERRIAALWQQLLKAPQVGREDDFFELGGDSLLVARLVGRLRESEPAAAGVDWEHLLRQMLRRPTVAALAAYLRDAAQSPAGTVPHQPEDSAPAPTTLVGATADGPATVLVHDGSGTLMPYQSLLDEYRRRPASGPVIGLETGGQSRYLDTDPALLIRRLGGEYAQALLADGGRRFHVVGYCMGGLIATEVARALVEAGAEVESLTAISCYRPPFEVHEDLIAEYTFALSLGVEPALLGFPVDDGELGRAISAVLAVTPGVLGAGALAALDGEFAKVGAAFRDLSARRPEERLAAIGRAAELPDGARLSRQYQIFRHSLFAVTRYRPEPYAGDVTFLRHTGRYGFLPGLQEDMSNYWQRVCLGELRIRDIPGDHFGCITGPRAEVVRDLLADSAAGVAVEGAS